jgi:DNA-binding FadR family transcriptional regulator
MAKPDADNKERNGGTGDQAARNRVSDQVLAQLVSMIVSGECAPGQKLPPERALAERLGVNRTTLREALRRLESMGLIAVRQGGGITVQNPAECATLEYAAFLVPQELADADMILSLEQARRVFALQAVRLAAERITDEGAVSLHKIIDDFPGAPDQDLLSGQWDFRLLSEIARLSGNMAFVCYLNTIRDTFGTMRLVYSGISGERLKALAALCAKMARAIAAGKKKKSVKLADLFLQEQAAALAVSLKSAAAGKRQ